MTCKDYELRRKAVKLKGFVYSYIDRNFPGYIQSMDGIAWLRYGKTTLELLIENPVNLYRLLLEHYGDEDSADYAMKMIYLYPLSLFLRDPGLQEELLRCVKQGDEDRFKEILKRLLCSV